MKEELYEPTLLAYQSSSSPPNRPPPLMSTSSSSSSSSFSSSFFSSAGAAAPAAAGAAAPPAGMETSFSSPSLIISSMFFPSRSARSFSIFSSSASAPTDSRTVLMFSAYCVRTENRAGYSGLLVSTEKEHKVSTKMSHLRQSEKSCQDSASFRPNSSTRHDITIQTSLIKY